MHRQVVAALLSVRGVLYHSQLEAKILCSFFRMKLRLFGDFCYDRTFFY